MHSWHAIIESRAKLPQNHINCAFCNTLYGGRSVLALYMIGQIQRKWSVLRNSSKSNHVIKSKASTRVFGQIFSLNFDQPKQQFGNEFVSDPPQKTDAPHSKTPVADSTAGLSLILRDLGRIQSCWSNQNFVNLFSNQTWPQSLSRSCWHQLY